MTRVHIAAAFVGGAVLLMQLAASGVAHDDEAPAAELDADYAAGKTAIKARQWSAAFGALLRSWPGLPHAGQLDEAFRHYQHALVLSPRHRAAHEHLGEAYLIVNDLAKAEEQLEALHQIRLIPCEELEELKEKIEAYKRSGKR